MRGQVSRVRDGGLGARWTHKLRIFGGRGGGSVAGDGEERVVHDTLPRERFRTFSAAYSLHWPRLRTTTKYDRGDVPMGLHELGEDGACRAAEAVGQHDDVLRRERRFRGVDSVAVAGDVDVREGIQAEVWGVQVQPDGGGEVIAMCLLWPV